MKKVVKVGYNQKMEEVFDVKSQMNKITLFYENEIFNGVIEMVYDDGSLFAAGKF